MKNIFIIIGLMLLVACEKEHIDDVNVERAVLVYMAADNNLSGISGSDLSEIIKGSKDLTDGQKLLLLIDRPTTNPYILEVIKGDTIRMKTYNEDRRSSDASLLEEVMQWMVARYPCDSYGLVLWGHADGWVYYDPLQASAKRRGYGVDMQNDTKTWMNIPDMADALSSTPKLDFIFADCCAFQSVESMYELRNVADYIIGSPAEIPEEGAPYSTIIPALFSNSSTFYQQVVDTYFNQTTYDGMKVLLSVVRTDKMEALAEATQQALQSFVPLLPDPTRPNIDGLIYYYSHTLFDMNDFMLRFADNDTYSNWKRAFDEAVIYKTYTDSWRANYVNFSDFTMTELKYGGLNMFVPQTNKYGDNYDKHISRQNEGIVQMQWYQAAGLYQLGW